MGGSLGESACLAIMQQWPPISQFGLCAVSLMFLFWLTAAHVTQCFEPGEIQDRVWKLQKIILSKIYFNH